MKLYLTIIGIAMAVIALFNIAFNTATWYYIVIAVVWCIFQEGVKINYILQIHCISF